MESLKVLIICLIILLVGLILFYLALYIAQKGMKKKIEISSIFIGFNQKMWMTGGLGLTFFGLYFLTVVFSSFFKDSPSRLDFFFLVYENPVIFIYLGLLTFASISTSIYLIRVVIKRYYNTRK